MMLSHRNTRNARSYKGGALRVLGILIIGIAVVASTTNSGFSQAVRNTTITAINKLGGESETASIAGYFASKNALLAENAQLKKQIVGYERTQQEMTLDGAPLQALCSLVNLPIPVEKAAGLSADKILRITLLPMYGLVVGFDSYVYGTVLVHVPTAEVMPKAKDYVVVENGSVIGEVASVGTASAVVELLTASGHVTRARVHDSEPIVFTGKGAHTLEAHLSQRVKVAVDDIVVLPGTQTPIAKVFEVVATPEDATQTVRARPLTNPASASVVRFVRYEE